MTEWYPCKWCEGEGGWHAHVEPSYSDPGEIIAKLRAELEQSRPQAFEESAKIAEGLAAQYQGRIEKLPENSYKIPYRLHSKHACEEVSQAIRQHSQKGRDND